MVRPSSVSVRAGDDERRPRGGLDPDPAELAGVDEGLGHVPVPQEHVGVAGGERGACTVEIADGHQLLVGERPAVALGLDERHQMRARQPARDRDPLACAVVEVDEVGSGRDVHAPLQRRLDVHLDDRRGEAPIDRRDGALGEDAHDVELAGGERGDHLAGAARLVDPGRIDGVEGSRLQRQAPRQVEVLGYAPSRRRVHPGAVVGRSTRPRRRRRPGARQPSAASADSAAARSARAASSSDRVSSTSSGLALLT